MHQHMAAALDEAIVAIRRIQEQARTGGADGTDGAGSESPRRWPLIVLRSPKGWTGPVTVDGLPVEGTWRAHQVPLAEVRTNPAHLAQLEEWLRSYRPQGLVDRRARPPDRPLGLGPHRARRLRRP